MVFSDLVRPVRAGRRQGARATGRAPALLWASAALVGTAALLPVAYLVVRTAGAGDETWDLLFRARTAAVLGRSASLMAAVTAFAVLIAVPVAWVTTRTDVPFGRALSVLAVLPLAVPSYVMGMVVVEAFGPRGGLQRLLAPLGMERFAGIYGLPGATLVIVLVSYPYVLLTVRAALRRLDPALEEAARSVGHGPVRTFWRVTLPALRPSLAAGALLAAFYALSDFGGVAILRYETFTSAVYLQYESSFNRSIAASLALVLAIVAVVVLMGESLSRGRAAYHRSSAGTAKPVGRVELGRWRWPAFIFVLMPPAVGLLVPLAVLGYWLSRGPAFGPEPAAGLGVLLWNSARVSLLAAVVTVACAVPVAVLSVRYRSFLSGVLEKASYLSFGLPGIAVALALVFFGINVARPLYQTTALLVFAYLVLFLPAAVGPLRASLLQVSPRLEEAARSLGRKPFRTLLAVTAPLVAPGALSGAAMVFLLTMKELPATLILSPVGFRTLATSTWSYATEAIFASAAVPALLLVLAAGIPTAYFVLRDPAHGNGAGRKQAPEVGAGDSGKDDLGQR